MDCFLNKLGTVLEKAGMLAERDPLSRVPGWRVGPPLLSPLDGVDIGLEMEDLDGLDLTCINIQPPSPLFGTLQ